MKHDHVYIIAEAGVNHNGSLDMAKQLVDVAVEAGVDAVKFQTFKAENLVSKQAPKAAYQQQTTDQIETQFDMLKKLELSQQAHQTLVTYCNERHIQFLSTPFDSESLLFLTAQYDLPYIKIPSGEITNAPFLLEIAQTRKPIILSTGMSTLGEIEMALGVLAYGYLGIQDEPDIQVFRKAFCSEKGQAVLQQNITLLHCTSEYPASFDEVNLRVLATMRQAFGLSVGYSDHTSGIAVAIAATALGATVIEKHFTLDKELPGPDHHASLNPCELKDMVKAIRQVERSLGCGLKVPSPSEQQNAAVARKSLVVKEAICRGREFGPDNLTIKRPGSGISPFRYWEFVGKKAGRDYQIDELIEDE